MQLSLDTAKPFPLAKYQFLAEQMRGRRLVDVGDADVLPTNPAGTFRNITDTVRAILDREATPLILGGDHSITFPVVRAFSEPLHVVHFDAHLDYQPFVHGLEMTALATSVSLFHNCRSS